MPEMIGLTGKSGVGKTRVCQQIVQAAKTNGFSISGFFCPAVFEDGIKTGINVSLLPGEETYPLATLENRAGWLQIGRWWMDPGVFDLVNEHLKSFTGSTLLVIDEIGPAEIEENKGWPATLDLLHHGCFKFVVVSFRPAYIDFFQKAYPGIKIINLDAGGKLAVENWIKRFSKPGFSL